MAICPRLLYSEFCAPSTIRETSSIFPGLTSTEICTVGGRKRCHGQRQVGREGPVEVGETGSGLDTGTSDPPACPSSKYCLLPASSYEVQLAACGLSGGKGVSISEIRWEGSVLCACGPRGIGGSEPPESPSSLFCAANALCLLSALRISHATPSKEHSATKVEQATIAARAPDGRCAVAGDVVKVTGFPGVAEQTMAVMSSFAQLLTMKVAWRPGSASTRRFPRALFRAPLATLGWAALLALPLIPALWLSRTASRLAALLALPSIPALWLSKTASPLATLLSVSSYPWVLFGPGSARQAESPALP